jgi:hypothetical protein
VEVYRERSVTWGFPVSPRVFSDDLRAFWRGRQSGQV